MFGCHSGHARSGDQIHTLGLEYPGLGVSRDDTAKAQAGRLSGIISGNAQAGRLQPHSVDLIFGPGVSRVSPYTTTRAEYEFSLRRRSFDIYVELVIRKCIPLFSFGVEGFFEFCEVNDKDEKYPSAKLKL